MKAAELEPEDTEMIAQNEPMDEPVDEPMDEPVDEPMDEPVDEPVDKAAASAAATLAASTALAELSAPTTALVPAPALATSTATQVDDGTAWLCTQCLTVMSSTDIEKCTNLKCQRKFKVFGCLVNESLRTPAMTGTRYQPPERRKPSRVAPGPRSAAPAALARNSAPAGGSAAQSSGGRGETLLLRSLQNHLEERNGHKELTVGWRVVWSVRKGGTCPGHVDVYYIEPGGRKFRSRSAVSR